MKIAWKKKAAGGGGKKRSLPSPVALNPGLPFDRGEDAPPAAAAGAEAGRASPGSGQVTPTDDHRIKNLADSFRCQGNQLAEDGKYHEAIGKWEAALTLEPKNAVLHEQKAQVLLELGDSWSALKAATQATELQPSWFEAWLTLGRAQLNFGEPDSAIESFDRALKLKADRVAAHRLVKKRRQLEASGLKVADSRYKVGDNVESS
ncbi:TPR [Musa troglodytarum]|uniref:TPR n=1 Tax=Musa troglodytarum TaxID=320322 RepID=A0A9E7JNP4_9LILI|nr:TPR [Musa troglodytarum]